MDRGTKKVLAAVAGALAAPLIVVVGVAVLHSPRSSENWDFATPMITMAALLPAALLGAVVGFVAMDLLQSEKDREARWLAGSGALLVVLIPVGIVVYPYLLGLLPSRPLTPAEKRTEWARWIRQAPAVLGERLADQLQGCLGEDGVPSSGEAVLANGCEAERRRWLGLGADKLGKLGAYTNTDDGWRWDVTDSAGPRRVTVFPDPLLTQGGPTFEVRRGRTVRHDPRPATSRDSTLPRLARFRECLRDWAVELRGAGAWSGSADSLPLLLPVAAPDTAGCPGIRIEEPADRAGLPWILAVRYRESFPLRVTYLPVFRGAGETPFQLFLFSDGVGYMLDPEGQWHTRNGQYPAPTDPPPEPCLIDPELSCE